jgi:hypothetical protein
MEWCGVFESRTRSEIRRWRYEGSAKSFLDLVYIYEGDATVQAACLSPSKSLWSQWQFCTGKLYVSKDCNNVNGTKSCRFGLAFTRYRQKMSWKRQQMKTSSLSAAKCENGTIQVPCKRLCRHNLTTVTV